MNRLLREYDAFLAAHGSATDLTVADLQAMSLPPEQVRWVKNFVRRMAVLNRRAVVAQRYAR